MPETHKLLKSQKNEVFESIKREGLDPANFSWSEGIGLSSYRNVPILNYLDGDYYFKFDILSGGHYCTFSPSLDQMVEHRHPETWPGQKSLVELWLFCIKKETEEPNLWAEVDKYKPTLSLLPDEQLLNETISPQVVERIEAKLQLFADEMKQHFKLNEGQQQVIQEDIDFLKDEAKHQKCRSWALMLFALLINISYQYSDKLNQFWELVGRTIGQIKILLNQ